MRTKRLQKSFIKDRTERERDRQIVRETDRQTDRQTESQRELESKGVIRRG